MKTFHGVGLVVGVAAALATMLAACNMDGFKGGKGRGEGDAQATHVSDFAGKGELCGTYVSYNGRASDAKTELGGPAGLMVQIGVCGKMSGNDWKALAVTHSSAEVAVVAGGSESSSAVFLDEKVLVVKRPDGKAATIGKLSKAERGYPIELSDGVKVQVLVDGEPFSLEQSKKAGVKSILVTLPD